MRLKGTLVQGYRVDSGLSTRDRRFPNGTLRMQAPFFAAEGLDYEKYFNGNFVWGTLNMDMKTVAYKQKKSDWFFRNVHWTDLQPAENFFVTKATIHFEGKAYKALWYNPDPSTKPNHFQYPTIIQFIAETIPSIKYGDDFEVEIADECIEAWAHEPVADDPNLKPWL